MFTGIIEGQGRILDIVNDGSNRHFFLESPFTPELKVDQSVAHNGICLTVVEIMPDSYRVTAIAETLNRTNLGSAQPGDRVNLERCMLAGSRFDGHIVQGHVDAVVKCSRVRNLDGSMEFTFNTPANAHTLLVEKGSVCLNGVSLTVVEAAPDHFTVHLIPFTLEHTNFGTIAEGTEVNIEYDIIGKYIARHMGARA